VRVMRVPRVMVAALFLLLVSVDHFLLIPMLAL
jgi:hypothetical protein